MEIFIPLGIPVEPDEYIIETKSLFLLINLNFY